MMRDHLERFLAPHGTEYEDLRREVDDSFGEPRLVVAAGSVLQGFGNSASDVDLHAVVDDGRVTDFHVSFHDRGFSVDVNYVEETWIKDAAARPLVPPRTRPEWKDEQRRLTQLGRFALGLPLAGRDDWLAWRLDAASAFAAHAAWWWRAEALRFRVAAELLVPAKPLLAAQRYCDAGLAALDAVAAAAGEAYVGTKWLGLKLTRLGRCDLLADHTRFLSLPRSPAEAPDYVAWARGALDALTAGWAGPAEPVVHVTPAPGTQVWKVRSSYLVQRLGLAGLELTPNAPGAPGAPGGPTAAAAVDGVMTWSGPVSALPEETRELLLAGLLWLAVTAAEPGETTPGETAPGQTAPGQAAPGGVEGTA